MEVWACLYLQKSDENARKDMTECYNTLVVKFSVQIEPHVGQRELEQYQ